MATLWTSPCHSTPSRPDWAIAAPTRPPISACDELDGSPSHQVIRFQTIAPISAASTVFSSARPVSMMPLPTVLATAVVTNAPARFATAAMATAIRGDSARVDSEVATAFAVSWKPFVKSKTSAKTIVMTCSVKALAILRQNRLEHVGSILAGVERLLELLVDVLAADDRQRVALRPEQLRDRLP